GTPTQVRRPRLYAWPGQQQTPWVSSPIFCPGGHDCSQPSSFTAEPAGQEVGTPTHSPREVAYTWPGQQQWPRVSLVTSRPLGQGCAPAAEAASASTTT